MICLKRLLNFVIRITYFSKLKLFGHSIFIGIVAKAVEGFSFDCRKYFGTNLARGHRFDVHILPKARTQKAKRKTNWHKGFRERKAKNRIVSKNIKLEHQQRVLRNSEQSTEHSPYDSVYYPVAWGSLAFWHLYIRSILLSFFCCFFRFSTGRARRLKWKNEAIGEALVVNPVGGLWLNSCLCVL